MVKKRAIPIAGKMGAILDQFKGLFDGIEDIKLPHIEMYMKEVARLIPRSRGSSPNNSRSHSRRI